MSTLQFRFYPPKKQQDINLVPSTTIVGQSALVAKSTAAKKRKSFSLGLDPKVMKAVSMGLDPATMLPPYGPTQATAMGSDVSGNYGGDARGYGNSFYGAQPYGESRERMKVSSGRKSYALYSRSLDLCESFE